MSAETHSLRKRFVKDYNLPIAILQDPYFGYLLDLYAHMDAREKYTNFVDLVDRLGGEQYFFEESAAVIERMIGAVKNHPNYGKFFEFDANNYKTSHNFGKSSAIFNAANDGRWFTSIDLVKANWQCLSYFDSSLVQGCESYRQWAQQFTDEDYYLSSKQIRQVVFGGLNPKRQQVIQRFMMDQIWHKLEEARLEIVGATSDEVIVIHNADNLKEERRVIFTFVPKYFDLHIKTFQLRQIKNKAYYKREYLDGSFDLKGVPAHYYPEVLQYVLGNSSNEMDRTTFFEGRVVRFLDPLFLN